MANIIFIHPRAHLICTVIAAMTIGKDVSMLFTDVVNCMQTDNVEMKKLVYLYLINYAKNQPDLAILAVNTFVKVCKSPFSLFTATYISVFEHVFFIFSCTKDTQDPNPLIRALAVRTMGCIRVIKITEYLCDPLQRALVVRLRQLSEQSARVRACQRLCFLSSVGSLC